MFALGVQFGRSWHSLRGLQLLSKPHVSVAVERVVSGWEASTSSVAMNKTSFIILRGWNLLFDTKIVHSMTECYAFPYILSYMLAKVSKTRMSAHMKVKPHPPVVGDIFERDAAIHKKAGFVVVSDRR